MPEKLGKLWFTKGQELAQGGEEALSPEGSTDRGAGGKKTRPPR